MKIEANALMVALDTMSTCQLSKSVNDILKIEYSRFWVAHLGKLDSSSTGWRAACKKNVLMVSGRRLRDQIILIV